MSTISATDLDRRIELLTTQIIGSHLDAMIEQIQNLATTYNLKKDREKSPFRNVITVANEPGSSLEVVKNYIRYQVGRSGSSKIWKDRDFANALVENIQGLQNQVNCILDELREKLTQHAPSTVIFLDGKNQEVSEQKSFEYYFDHLAKPKLTKKLHLQLCQLYLGYLAREHTALLSAGTQQTA